MARNLHTYHSFALKLRHIVVLGGFDPTKQFLERKFTYSDYSRGTQREYSSKLFKHRIVKRILVF